LDCGSIAARSLRLGCGLLERGVAELNRYASDQFLTKTTKSALNCEPQDNARTKSLVGRGSAATDPAASAAMKRLNVLIMVANITKWYVRIGLKEDGKVTLSREEGGMGNKVRDQPGILFKIRPIFYTAYVVCSNIISSRGRALEISDVPKE
jgi:hypothetical protein